MILNVLLKVLGHSASAEPPHGDILDALSRIAEDRPRCPKMAPRWCQDGSKMLPEGVLGVSWGALGASWGRLGASWGPLGAEGSGFLFVGFLFGTPLGRAWGPPPVASSCSSRSISNCRAMRRSLFSLCSAVSLGSRHGLGWMLRSYGAVEPRALGKSKKAHLLPQSRGVRKLHVHRDRSPQR